MARTYRAGTRRRFAHHSEEFRCRRCRMMVFPPASGGRHRNHCPYCLWSRHVDGRVPGDRASECGSVMQPVGVLGRANGEQAVLHRCLGCGLERHCRVAADDDPQLIMRLVPVSLPAGAGEIGRTA